MNCTGPKKILLFAAAALACFPNLNAASAQETWGQGGGASVWQAGSTPNTTSPRPTAGSGGGASWTAGRSSLASGVQRGGVWHDGAAVPATLSKVPTRGPAAGALPTNKVTGVTTLKPLPAVVHKSAPAAKLQSPRASVGSHSPLGPHFGAKSGTHGTKHGGARRSPKSGSTSFGSQSQRSNGITGWKTSTDKTLDSTKPPASSEKPLD
jgi:hypothetical protein